MAGRRRRGLRGVPRPRRPGPRHLQGSLDRVLRGLVAHDQKGALDRSAAARLLEQVEELAGHDLGPHAVVDHLRPGQGLGAEARPVQDLVGPGQAQVAEQDRRPLPEPVGVPAPARRAVHAREASVGRCPTAAQVGVVHHVVVDQGARLQQLQRGRGAQGLVHFLSAGAEVAPHAERRAQPLSPREQLGEPVGEGHEVRGDVGQDVRLLGHECVQGRLDRRHQAFGAQARLGRHGAQPRARPGAHRPTDSGDRRTGRHVR